MARILIVDDNPDVAFMVREKLVHLIGGEIEIANGGEACLEMAKDISPDLILLDINMPVLDGFEVCRLLKMDPDTQDIPIIFLSATYDDLRSKIKGLDIGADDYMVQPVDDLELVTRVKTLLQVKELKNHVKSLRLSLYETRQDRDEMCKKAHSTGQAIIKICCNHDGKPKVKSPLKPDELALIKQHAENLLSYTLDCLDKWDSVVENDES